MEYNGTHESIRKSLGDRSGYPAAPGLLGNNGVGFPSHAGRASIDAVAVLFLAAFFFYWFFLFTPPEDTAATFGASTKEGAIDYSDYTYVSSYQYRIDDQPPQYVSATSSYKSAEPPTFKDDNGNGIVSVSVFVNSNGEQLEVQIPDERYEDIGKEGGAQRVPEKSEIPALKEAETKI